MNYLVCPDDGEHLKADLPRAAPGAPLVVRCPNCERAFVFAHGALEPITDPGAR